ncbi:hypothetical protein HC256_004969 [Beauveria bassiana]|nr:hypothetical protein HC256_004969 [Beauveria bassiana]
MPNIAWPIESIVHCAERWMARVYHVDATNTFCPFRSNLHWQPFKTRTPSTIHMMLPRAANRTLVTARTDNKVLARRVGAGRRDLRLVRIVVCNLVRLQLGIRLAAKKAADGSLEQEKRDLDDGRVLVRGRSKLLGLFILVSTFIFNPSFITCTCFTHVKEILVDIALLILLLEEHMAHGVDNEHLAILSNDSLLDARGRHRSIARRRLRGGALGRLLLGRAAVLLARLLIHHATLLAVARLRHGRVLLLGGRVGRGRCRSGLRVEAGNVAAPGRVARKLDVATHKLLLPLPVHVEDQVVHRAAGKHEQADNDGAQAGPVAVVVVVGALPQREPVGQEVVVAVARRALEDAHNQRQARLAVRRLLHGRIDLRRRGHLARLAAVLGLARPQLLPHLVRMELARLLAVCLRNGVLRGMLRDVQNVVERGLGVSLVRRDFVADAKDFAVF